ncbi:MAG: LemA family protein [Methanobrevibacter ruminantium]|uniref:LemA family protein n=1 Tax=Methanobrevibacter ruminantium TaxID=83816 RepID=UPI0026F31553|nr:LemA family protein [Methanobrevibacter ruminantium]MCI5737972.1 LemA family protein [Methanobrevibacter ruminantium]MDD6049308.1 LemA family protein [Methanobrevibacter ruminantium]
MNILLIILIVIIIIILVAIVAIYNGLVTARNKVKNAWAQIDVQLNRRSDLIPNLVETVKGYAAHESSVFEDVTAARAGLMNANGVKEIGEANNQLSSTLKTLFAVAENYPELKANENFKELQEQLAQTEDKIAYSRQFYNDTVLMYNNKCQTFPSNIFAGMFGFKEADFFEAAGEARSVPKVEF